MEPEAVSICCCSHWAVCFYSDKWVKNSKLLCERQVSGLFCCPPVAWRWTDTALIVAFASDVNQVKNEGNTTEKRRKISSPQKATTSTSSSSLNVNVTFKERKIFWSSSWPLDSLVLVMGSLGLSFHFTHPYIPKYFSFSDSVWAFKPIFEHLKTILCYQLLLFEYQWTT